uniref:Uncharacterized protein n=1 Tax=Gracilinema caldarium TaxID=215591 RepID=A0A7C3HVY8_9SPIR
MKFSKPFLMALLLPIILFGACKVPVTDADDPAIYQSTLVLQFRSAQSRLMGPQDILITRYSLSAAGPEGRSLEKTTDKTSLELDLVPGTWTFTIEGSNQAGAVLARGALVCTLGAGERRVNPVNLYPQEGLGSLALTWTIAGELTGNLEVRGILHSAEDSIQDQSFTVPAQDKALTISNLSAGAYELEIALWQDDGRLCGIRDSVLILANQMSLGTIAFTPLSASLSMQMTIPDFTGTPVALLPARRRVAPGIGARFIAILSPSGPSIGSSYQEVSGAWYLEGQSMDHSASSVQAAQNKPGTYRLDWIGDTGGVAKQSATAQLVVKTGAALGPFGWAETLTAEDLPTGTGNGLSDCRDLARSPSGAYVLAAGKTKSTLSLLTMTGPGTIQPIASLNTSAVANLGSPSRIINMEDENTWLVLFDASGSAALINFDPVLQQLKVTSYISSPNLVGLCAAVYQADLGRCILAVPDQQTLFALSVSGGTLSAPTLIACQGQGGLEFFSKPASLAYDRLSHRLAVGTLGDDGLYFFNAASADSLPLLALLPKETFSAFGSFSDPIGLAFSSDGQDLYALTYYGKTLFRLRANSQTGIFEPIAGIRSGYNGASGFDYPKRMALAPNNAWIAITGSGSNDGLTLIAVQNDGILRYEGTLRRTFDEGAIGKPVPVLFSADSRLLVTGSSEEASLVMYYSGS